MDPRRQIPPIHRLLDAPAFGRLIGLYGRDPVTIHLRRAVDGWRREVEGAAVGSAVEVLGGDAVEEVAERPADAAVEDAVCLELARRTEGSLMAELGRPLARVINATGILVHTNLGRSPLPAEVARALPPLLDAACDLEIDLATGRRGDRNRRPAALLAAATGAEAAVVVNNNAAAIMLALATNLAPGRRQAIVSRGELVEIGGSFRVPDVLAAVGAELVEVGTTNRTRLADYAAALSPRTAVLLKVHPSNFRVSGFTAAVGAGALADLGRRRGVPVVADEGSGLLAPRREPQFADHDSLATLVAAGCALACGSGDKLLGGPQAGLIVGREEAVARCRRHPLYRALRPDRTTLAALELVLRRHLAGAPAPLDRLWPEPAAHRRRLEEAASRLAAAGVEAAIVPADAYLGGGSAPERPIPGEALALAGGDALLARLRTGAPPVAGYLTEGRLVLDLRTVAPDDDRALLGAVVAAAAVLPGAAPPGAG